MGKEQGPENQQGFFAKMDEWEEKALAAWEAWLRMGVARFSDWADQFEKDSNIFLENLRKNTRTQEEIAIQEGIDSIGFKLREHFMKLEIDNVVGTGFSQIIYGENADRVHFYPDLTIQAEFIDDIEEYVSKRVKASRNIGKQRKGYAARTIIGFTSKSLLEQVRPDDHSLNEQFRSEASALITIANKLSNIFGDNLDTKHSSYIKRQIQTWDSSKEGPEKIFDLIDQFSKTGEVDKTS